MPATPATTLLSPENHSLLLIDHQYLQMMLPPQRGMRSGLNCRHGRSDVLRIFYDARPQSREDCAEAKKSLEKK